MDVLMKICVCVGSSCHLKGSYDIINLMKAALEKYGLTDTVDLSGRILPGQMHPRRLHQGG